MHLRHPVLGKSPVVHGKSPAFHEENPYTLRLPFLLSHERNSEKIVLSITWNEPCFVFMGKIPIYRYLSYLFRHQRNSEETCPFNYLERALFFMERALYT